MVSRLSLLAAVLLLACTVMPAAVMADTPANCTYADMLGHWNVFVTAPGDKSVNCSTATPSISVPGITFKYPNIAIDDNGNQGNWTLIYNQGVEVWIAGRIHMAYSAYSANGSVSYCDRTQVGWSHNEDGSNWNCLYAQRSNANDEYDIEAPVAKEAVVTKALDQEQKYVHDKKFLDAVNAAQDYFTVKHYPEFEQYTVSQLQRKLGSKNPDGLRASLPPHAVEKKAHHRHSSKKLPASWDWRNVSGENFVSPVRDQGQCGSCYAFSSAGMMEARIRIASNNAKQPVLSTQDVVSCSQYSQGCEGGFPYLVAGKYARDWGMSEEQCYPYVGVDEPCNPNPQPGCNPDRWFTNEYYYVGGYYGMSNPTVMMEEIMTNGPISVSFEVYDDFMGYSGGVYTHQFTKHLSSEFNPFELVNHAVLCVGWGTTDDNVPCQLNFRRALRKTQYFGQESLLRFSYWIVKNSWGESWGESGYFRILRGSSEAGGECAIESITVSAIPILQQ